jgi:hypothetical protein
MKESSLFSSCGSSNPDVPFDAFVDGCMEDILVIELDRLYSPIYEMSI